METVTNNFTAAKIANKPYEVHQYEHRPVTFTGFPPPYYNYHYCVASFDSKEEALDYMEKNNTLTLRILYRDPIYGLIGC